MFFVRFFLVASAIGGAIAQTSGVSTQCENTLIAVLASPQAECLNPNGLVQIFVQGNSSSVVTPVDTWLKGLCARGPCSNDDIAAIVTNITTGCAADLQLGNTQPGSLTPLVQKIYPTVRKAVCLADASKNNQLCVTQTLSNIESVTGTLTINKISQISSSVDGSSINGVNLCTPCIKQMYNVANADFPAVFGKGTTIASDVQARCGASFIDGASDPNIVQTASNNNATSKTNASTDGCGQSTGRQALLSTFLFGLLALAV